MKSVFFVIPILIAVLLCSCTHQNSAVNEDGIYYSFTDSLGNEVKLTKKPKKTAILFSSYADIWALSGGTVDLTVGEAVERGFADKDAVIVDNGSGHNTIDLEMIIAHSTELVIGTADHKAQTEACEFAKANGIPSALFKVEALDDYLKVLKICCDINNSPEAYELYGTKVKEDTEKILETVSSASPDAKKVLFIRAGSSARSTKAKNSNDNFTCKMLRDLGAVNIADSAPILLDGLSMEDIIAQSPQHIFISTMGDEGASYEYVTSLFQSDVWQSLECIRNGNYTFLPKELFHFKPNAKWADAYRYLAKILYPELKID